MNLSISKVGQDLERTVILVKEKRNKLQTSKKTTKERNKHE